MDIVDNRCISWYTIDRSKGYRKKNKRRKKMKRMKEIIDTWNIIDRYNIQGWKQENGSIYIPNKEFDRVFEEILNKSYLINLIK